MFKNIIIGVLITVAIALAGGAVYAKSVNSGEITTVGYERGPRSSVYSFKHNGNRCYVAQDRKGFNAESSISCVRFDK